MAPLDRLCVACASLNLVREDFLEPPFERGRNQGDSILEGSLDVLRRSQNCPLCRLILRALSKNERGSLPSDGAAPWVLLWGPNNPEYEPTRQNEDLFGSGLYANLTSNHFQREYRIELIDDDPASGFLRARKLPQGGIDTHQLQGWIRACQDAHGTIHEKSYFQGSINPLKLQGLRVIDVCRRCLTVLGEGEEYVALSYVWGTKNDVTTKKANLERFSTEGAFLYVELPKTIRDTIDLTHALGYSYLWVDSLCIVQDDDSVKPQLIANMGSIYANAIVTIVAASGSDANAGLSGFHEHSRASTNTPLEMIGPELQLGVLPHFAVELMESCHATRGWTFQEVCLSPRCIVFLNGSTYFSCLDALWREDVIETPDVKAAHGAGTFNRSVEVQPLQMYGALVESYSERDLTFPSDGLHAFAGVLSALSQQLGNSRMFYGIPAAVFDWALLWQSLDELTRRPCFPSWAWVGVRGRLMLPSPYGLEIDHDWLLQRTWIDWYIICQPGATLVPIWDPDRDDTSVTQREQAKENKMDEDESRGTEIEGEGGEEEFEDEDETEDDEEYEELCPTYASPSSASLHGRLDVLLPDTFPQMPQDSKLPTAHHQRFSYPDGTLYFTTLSLRLQIDHQFLHDSEGRKCGVLLGPTLLPESSSPERYEILILSWASPGTTGAHHGFTKELDTEYRASDEARSEGGGAGVQWEPLAGGWHAWAYLNVLVVRPSELGGRSQQQDRSDNVLLERVGIGLLHVRALDQVYEDRPRWRKVWLY